jgi:hypothetical protein
LAQISHLQPRELVATRFQAHPLQQLARAALALAAFAHARVQLLHVRRELVAHTLERPEVEQPGTAEGSALDRRRRGNVWEALGHDRPALALQARDLCAQGSPRGALVRSPGQRLCAATLGDHAASPPGVATHPGRVVSIDDLLVVVGHTRLLSGRERFYQRTCRG